MTSVEETEPPVRSGRAPMTSVAELTTVGLRLFVRHGFDAVTVDQIARTAGIGRRTFFRYFPSKNDLAWGDFDSLLSAMRSHLQAVPAEVPLFDALRDAVIAFNRYPAAELELHRQRMRLLLSVPSLVAHGMLRYAEWRDVLAEFAGARLDVTPRALGPQTISWAFLGAALAAYDAWLTEPESDLAELIADAIEELRALVD